MTRDYAINALATRTVAEIATRISKDLGYFSSADIRDLEAALTAVRNDSRFPVFLAKIRDVLTMKCASNHPGVTVCAASAKSALLGKVDALIEEALTHETV